MNWPTLASLAPGVVVFGKIVSATSSKKAISDSVKVFETPTPASGFLQPARKNSPPITTPPVAAAIIFNNSRLSIIKNLIRLIKHSFFSIHQQQMQQLLQSAPYT